MIAVRVMQVPIDQVVDVIAVGNRLVAALRTVDVGRRMIAACVLRRAIGGIFLGDVEGMFFDGTPFGVVQVAVVQVIDVIAVLDRGVAAALAVIMIVLVVMVAHFSAFLSGFRPAWGNGSLFRLLRMGQRVLNQVNDVLIGEGVVQMRSLPAAHDESFGSQEAQSLGDGGKLFTKGLHEFGDAAFPLHEVFQQAQSGGVSEGSKQATCLVERRGAGFREFLGGMLSGLAAGVLGC